MKSVVKTVKGAVWDLVREQIRDQALEGEQQVGTQIMYQVWSKVSKGVGNPVWDGVVRRLYGS